MVSVVVFSFAVFSKNLPAYRDEDIYIGCGLRMVRSGVPPSMCNYEHPPVAKYLIGFSVAVGLGDLFKVLFLVFTVLGTFFVGRELLSWEDGLVASILLVGDTLFLNVYRFFLLDPVSLMFFVWALFSFFRGLRQIERVV